MNKKLLFVDVISFFVSIFILILVRVCNIFEVNDLMTNIVFTALTIIISVFSMLFVYKCDNKNKLGINIILCFVFVLLLYLIYTLPIFDFVGQKGVSNSICMVFEILFGSKYLIYLSYVLNTKNVGASIRSNEQLFKPHNISFSIVKNSFNSNQRDYNFFRVLGVFVFIGGIIGAIFNAVMPVIDMSVPYQVIVLQKSLNEIM